MASSTITRTIQTISISISLLASGGIATLSLFDVPVLQSQPASRSLPSTRWLFSRGSHIFPTAAFISSGGFAYLAYSSLPPGRQAVTQILKIGSNGVRTNRYMAAAAFALSIAPFTQWAMIPTNFTLIEMNEERGGARSEKSASAREQQSGAGNALDSVSGKGQAAEFTDLSGPQSRTSGDTTMEEDERVRELLSRFGRLNLGRAALLGGGGVLALMTALAA